MFARIFSSLTSFSSPQFHLSTTIYANVRILPMHNLHLSYICTHTKSHSLSNRYAITNHMHIHRLLCVKMYMFVEQYTSVHVPSANISIQWIPTLEYGWFTATVICCRSTRPLNTTTHIPHSLCLSLHVLKACTHINFHMLHITSTHILGSLCML